jgi:hypothetical protein
VPSQFLLERCLLVLHDLPLDQPVLADRAHGQCRRAGKAVAALSA